MSPPSVDHVQGGRRAVRWPGLGLANVVTGALRYCPTNSLLGIDHTRGREFLHLQHEAHARAIAGMDDAAVDLERARHVGRAEEELRRVAAAERRVSSALVALIDASSNADSWKAPQRLGEAALLLAHDQPDEAQKLVEMLPDGKHKRQIERKMAAKERVAPRPFFW